MLKFGNQILVLKMIHKMQTVISNIEYKIHLISRSICVQIVYAVHTMHVNLSTCNHV